MQTLHTPIAFNEQPETMTKLEYNKVLSTELYYDIVAFMSVLYKMGFDESVENESLFVEMLNESDFRTVQGKPFSIMSYRLFMSRMCEEVKYNLKNELKRG